MSSQVVFNGIRFIENPMLDNMPRMYLSEAARKVVTPEFAAEMDSWMLEFFGTQSIAVAMAGGVVAVGPKAIAVLRIQHGCEVV